MNPLLRTVLGIQESESEDAKLSKETVVYLTPEQIGNDKGAHCGGCIFFGSETSDCFLTSPSKCNAEHGVCALFLGAVKRKAILQKEGKPLQLIPKEAVGYVEIGPTRCSTCEYWKGKTKDDPDASAEEQGSCEKVDGEIWAGGCCNAWEEC